MQDAAKKTPYHHKFSPGSSHAILLELLARYPDGTTILDVGTATGILGWRCQGRGFILKGIEQVKEWADMAKPFYREIFIGGLEQASDEILSGHQVVVCADVLEHMPDPKIQLSRLVALQPAGASFLISVPNVANLWVRLHLLMGRFDYADRGILDRTHLRFFTRRTITELVESTGLQVKRVLPTSIPLELVHPFFTQAAMGRGIHRLLVALTNIFPTILGYQFMLEAQKSA